MSMANLSLLPEQLRYLQPFRRKFASRAAEALNEDTGTDRLIGLLAKRINGLSVEESEKALGLDLAVLEEWLGQPENENDCLQFVRGFFLVGSLNQIVEMVREESKKQLIKPPLVEMDWPPGAKMRGGKGVRKEGGFWLRWKQLDCVMDAVSEEASLNFADAEMRREADYETIEISRVRFGEAHGQKICTDWKE
jgi:hypothetical protein